MATATRPTSIAAFQQMAQEEGMPLEDIHMSLGENSFQPDSYGIYRDPDSKNVVVYRNKADGTRRVRYRGNDEAKACEILYDKFFEELGKLSYGVSEKADFFRTRQLALQNYAKQSWKLRLGIFLVTFGLIGASATFITTNLPQVMAITQEGYYYDNSNYYYYSDGDWMIYDYSIEDWKSITKVPFDGQESEHFIGSDYEDVLNYDDAYSDSWNNSWQDYGYGNGADYNYGNDDGFGYGDPAGGASGTIWD